MQISRKINESLKAISVIETIATTYREVSQREVDRIRDMALKNRYFIEELSRVCVLAKKSIVAENGSKTGTVSDGRKDKCFCFFSANARFYGSLILDVWRTTFYHLNEEGADLVVIGEVGKNLIEKGNPDLDFTYFELDDDRPSEEQIGKIIKFIKDYKEISVFHGKFKTVLTQEVTRSDISKNGVAEGSDGEIPSYLFEPSPEAVLEFFETELIGAFFNQAFLEHRLSRHAMRMVNMYSAGENAKERKKKLGEKLKKVKKRLADRKQLEIIIPYQLWE